MFIINIEDAKLETYVCGRVVADYLIKKGFPILSRDFQSNKFIFSKTDSLISELKNAPIWLKLFS